jgi:hypothetical protein
MAYSQAPTVRLERQAHRDAVIRVREAYRRLLRSQRPSVSVLPGAAGSPASAQEVRA